MENSPSTLTYQFDRYEASFFCDTYTVHYHNVANIDIHFTGNINWYKVNFIKITDKKNNISIKYTVDHKKIQNNIVFYHTPLFKKKRHYEFFKKHNKSFYIFFFFNEVQYIKYKKSYIWVTLHTHDKTLLKSNPMPINYNTSYKEKNFPTFKKIITLENPPRIKIQIYKYSQPLLGQVQYQLSGKTFLQPFVIKKNAPSITLPLQKHDTYLAVMLNNKNYENKFVLKKKCIQRN